MHIPKTFRQEDPQRLNEIIRQYPFATLITHSDSGPEANHIPFVLTQSNGKDVLLGHIAKVNPLWKEVADRSSVLVIFHGPNCYVSPNFYPTKQENGRAVPTWNYVAVHVRGELSFKHDEEWNLQMIDRLTKQHEAERPEPWSIADAPEKYTRGMLRGIVGLEIEIASIRAQWKVSQNQPQQNRRGVVAGLSDEANEGAQRIAELVQEHILESD